MGELTLKRAIRAYMAEKSPETFAKVESVICQMSLEKLWATIDRLIADDDSEVVQALAELAVETRPATKQEEKVWWNINGIAYPIFGYLQDNYGEHCEMLNLAHIIVSHYEKASSDEQASIKAIIGVVDANTPGFYSNDSVGHEDEKYVYGQILGDDPSDTDI